MLLLNVAAARNAMRQKQPIMFCHNCGPARPKTNAVVLLTLIFNRFRRDNSLGVSGIIRWWICGTAIRMLLSDFRSFRNVFWRANTFISVVPLRVVHLIALHHIGFLEMTFIWLSGTFVFVILSFAEFVQFITLLDDVVAIVVHILKGLQC